MAKKSKAQREDVTFLHSAGDYSGQGVNGSLCCPGVHRCAHVLQLI